MTITGPLLRAARALVQWPRDHVARLAGLEAALIADFEAGRASPDLEAQARLRRVMEEGGAVFIDEGPEGGVGVRLKFNRKDVRAIGKWENEGGPPADDDV
ncbi:MAG: DNA-binding protein [Phenylobacterium sp.]|nr:DNA-binding protein [Phenylobacterium sp.]